MKKYPNKIVSVRDSIFMPMREILETIPTEGISCVDLQERLRGRISVEDFVDAMTNLYAICMIEVNDNNVVRRLC